MCAGAHTTQRASLTVALDVSVRLAVVAAEWLGSERPNLVGTPHAQVEYLGEGPSEGDLDLERGFVAAVSCRDGTAAGEGDSGVFLQGVERVEDRVSLDDALPLLLDLGDGGSGVPGNPGQREGGFLVQGLEVQGGAPHYDAVVQSRVFALERAGSQERGGASKGELVEAVGWRRCRSRSRVLTASYGGPALPPGGGGEALARGAAHGSGEREGGGPLATKAGPNRIESNGWIVQKGGEMVGKREEEKVEMGKYSRRIIGGGQTALLF